MSACGRLLAATLELTKATPIKQRLIDTYSGHLTKIDLGDLPPALRLEARALLEAFAQVPPLRGESAVQATVRKLSSGESEALAARVVALYGQMARVSAPRAVEDTPRLAEGLTAESILDEDAELRPRLASGA